MIEGSPLFDNLFQNLHYKVSLYSNLGKHIDSDNALSINLVITLIEKGSHKGFGRFVFINFIFHLHMHLGIETSAIRKRCSFLLVSLNFTTNLFSVKLK